MKELVHLRQNPCDTIAENNGNLQGNENVDLQHEILSKLDTIQQSLPLDNHRTSKQIDGRLQTLVFRRRTLKSKVLRSKQLSQHYQELIDREQPFVPRKFRTKIHRTTPEFERNIHKGLSINKVETEIKIMKCRIKKWESKLVSLGSDIEVAASSLEEPKRKDLYTRLSRDSEKVQRDRVKSFEKLRNTYEEDIKRNGSNPELFLLTIVDNRKNWKSQSRPPNYNQWTEQQQRQYRWEKSTDFGLIR